MQTRGRAHRRSVNGSADELGFVCKEWQKAGCPLTLGPARHHREALIQLQEGFQIVLQSHLGEGDMRCGHSRRGWNTSLMYKALEHLLICCLGIEQVVDPLLFLSVQLEEGLMLGLVELGKVRDEFSQR